MTENIAIARASNLDIYSVEGMDGSGKTSFIDYFCNRLASLHQEPLLATRMPILPIRLTMIKNVDEILASKENTDEKILNAASETMGRIVLSKKDHPVIYSTDQSKHLPGRVYCPARCMHGHILDDDTKSAIAYYPVYVLDRGRASYYAYQVHAKNSPRLMMLLTKAMQLDENSRVNPEYIWLDINPQTADEAIKNRKNLSAFDQESISFKQNLRIGYQQFFTKHYKNCLKVNVDQIRKEYTSINECNEAIFQLWCEKYLQKLINQINQRF